MAFSLDKIVPWGRSLDEYIKMFNLTPEDRKRTILGCADGPASFNAEWTRLGGKVVSIDPIYELSAEQISNRINETAEEVFRKVEQNEHDFVWSDFSSPEDLLKKRLTTMQLFLDDFHEGLERGRYLPAEVLDLPFAAKQFELALCSHFLCLYSEQLTGDFHRSAISELLRVANEVRIFPILELGNAPCRYLNEIIEEFNTEQFSCKIEETHYEFQIGANQMLRVTRTCA